MTTVWTVLRTEMRRGVAPLAFLGIAIVAGVLFANELERWAGRWAELNGWTRAMLLVLGPIAMALAAWFGGRDGRRRIDELLTSTPRPRLHRVLLGWGTATIGAAAGLTVAWAVAAVLVARVATYDGGPSWVTLGVAFVGVGLCVAVGYAIGRAVRGQAIGIVTGALVGIAGYVLFGVATYASNGLAWLIPSTFELSGGRYLVDWVVAAQVVFFVAVAVTLLLLVGARRRLWALVPLAATVIAAAPLAGVERDDVIADDTDALELVCTDGSPDVCAQVPLEFTLDDLESAAQEALSTWSGIPGVPERVAATRFDRGDAVGENAVVIALDQYVRWDGSLAPRGEWGSRLVEEIRRHGVPSVDPQQCGYRGDSRRGSLSWQDENALRDTALRIVGSDPNNGVYGVDEIGDPIAAPDYSDPLWGRVSTYDRADQAAWFDTYATAVEGCDFEGLADLVTETVS